MPGSQMAKVPKTKTSLINLLALKDDNEDLAAIQNETNILLAKIHLTEKKNSKKRPRKVVGRVTIEVLDNVSTPSTARSCSTRANTSANNESCKLVNKDEINGYNVTVDDGFGFGQEELRVRNSLDIFLPDTAPSKHALEKQMDSISIEQMRLKNIEKRSNLSRDRQVL